MRDCEGNEGSLMRDPSFSEMNFTTLMLTLTLSLNLIPTVTELLLTLALTLILTVTELLLTLTLIITVTSLLTIVKT